MKLLTVVGVAVVMMITAGPAVRAFEANKARTGGVPYRGDTALAFCAEREKAGAENYRDCMRRQNDALARLTELVALGSSRGAIHYKAVLACQDQERNGERAFAWTAVLSCATAVSAKTVH